jgi:hypothetical protein
MKKIFSLTLSIILLAGCTKDLTGLNDDPKNPKVVPSYSLFSNAQKSLSDAMASSNVNLNIFRMLAQHWTETTYTDEANFDLATRNIPQNWWARLYRDVLRDFDEAKNLIPTDVTDPTMQKNELAMTDIMEVYVYHVLVTTFGNVPYKEALNINNAFPVYDDAATIYSDLLTRLDQDIANLDPSGESFGESDLIYGGDVNAWIKFANSLKLKMGMIIADVDPDKAKSIVESAAPNVFTSNDDNAVFRYLTAPPNTNPIWVDLVQSGRKDFVAANTVVDKMLALNDPRVPLFFTRDANGNFTGGTFGASNNYATYSKPSTTITAPDFPGTFIDYSEVEFLLAEAVERGMNVGGTAMEHYNKAVTASIEFWGGTEAQAQAYLANPAVNYSTAAGDWKEKIGTQKWIALYNRGYDAWTEWRRLDFPKLEAPADAVSDIPLRLSYPVNEQNLNVTNYNQAASAIGGDLVTTRLFFDKF